MQDSSHTRLVWNRPPLSVLVITKIHDISVIPPFLDLIRWLIWVRKFSFHHPVDCFFFFFVLTLIKNPYECMNVWMYECMHLFFQQEKRMSVFVEPAVLQDLNLRSNQAFSSIIEKLSTFKEDSLDKVDFIICLGGDGTLLYASSLFQVRKANITTTLISRCHPHT